MICTKMESENTQQVNGKGKSKQDYNAWTVEKSRMLLQLMVDATSHGRRDANGMLSKATIETKLLPKVNEKLRCHKTYSQYQSRLKYFKREYQKYSQLLHHSFGFGWDPTTKKFTAPEEVWKDYFKSHPKDTNIQTKTCEDYEDLQIVIGNATAIGRNSLGLDDDTDARTFRAEDRHVGIEDFVFDDESQEDEEIYETIWNLLMAIQVVAHALNEIMMHSEEIERPLTRRPITMKGYDYIQHVLNDDPEHFRERYRMYPDALNTIAPEMLAKPGSAIPAKIRESTRFYPYFKDCIGAIDGTHIPTMVTGRDVSSYRNRHGTISQNVLAACNFDLEFIYVLSGWEGSAHDSRVLQDALTRRNGLKVPQVYISSYIGY
ncbi:transposable element gene [Prunus dulcis]|uniref:Transposable element protein n=1 Tax=Prunus dulcis TaxID=3755 RepID=A0A4Y1RNX6_PRUDU|nr:transposable element gene [Prunus dulcis]